MVQLQAAVLGGVSGTCPVLHNASARRRCLHCRNPDGRQSNRAGALTTTCHVGFTSRSKEYNQQMQKQMGWDNPYEYHFDRGLYYHEIVDNLICGSQPRNVEDIKYLKEHENVGVIINLQQDKDFHYWGIDFHNIYHKAKSLGMKIIRKPARDFDPNSLRYSLPSAVHAVEQALADGHRVYVHCTAGLGRAPAVCIAFLYWFRNMALDEAYNHLTLIRPCGPKKEAIRGATYDLITGGEWHQFDHIPSDAYAQLAQQDMEFIQTKIRNHQFHFHT